MEDAWEEKLRQKHMAFIGKVVSCFPHTIRNRLATIRESSGLISDILVQQDQKQDEEDRAKFSDIMSTIENQVDILARKSQYLDRFARRMGKTLTAFDIRDVVEESVSFLGRFAHLRRVSLELDTAGPLPGLCGDALKVYFTVSVVINDMLGRVENGGKVVIHLERAGNEVLTEVLGHGVPDSVRSLPGEKNPFWQTAGRAVEDMDGRLDVSAIENGIEKVILFLPVKQSP